MISTICIDVVQPAAFTPRQAHFLLLVLEHAGVCLPRQYRAFAGVSHGRHSHRFFAKLITGGFATTDLAAPASGATNQPASVPLTWGASTGAASYEWCVDQAANGTCDGAWWPHEIGRVCPTVSATLSV